MNKNIKFSSWSGSKPRTREDFDIFVHVFTTIFQNEIFYALRGVVCL